VPLIVDDRRHTLALAGSPRLDAFKAAHKARLSPLAFATDVDLLVVEKHPPGIAAILDVKGPDEPLSFAQVVAFEAFRAALPDVPIFVVAVDDATRGPFRVTAYLRGDWRPRPPAVLLSDPRILPDWPAFSAWETALRRDFRGRRALARQEASPARPLPESETPTS
jgi:hypothetical protein